LKRGFTFIELIAVILIIGIIAGIMGVKVSSFLNKAKESAEISTALSVLAALDRIEGRWSMEDSDFDWDNDGVIDNIKNDLSSDGYPYRLEKEGDCLGKVLKRGQKSGFVLRVSNALSSKVLYSIFTGPASDPLNGVSFPKEAKDFDIASKPDRNDFWLYVIESNVTDKRCFVKGNFIDPKQINAGDFILIDVKGKKRIDFNKKDLGIGFKIECN